MQKLFILILLSAMFISCKQENVKQEKKETVDTEKTSTLSIEKFGVKWYWVSDDPLNFESKNSIFKKELNELWESGVIENVYFGVEQEVEGRLAYPTIAFFINASSDQEARKILNNLTIVHEGIASYNLVPVGLLWMDRKNDAVKALQKENAYISIWHMKDGSKLTDSLTVVQNDMVLNLWKEGVIENIYFNIEGTIQDNKRKDFIFFVNANSKEEARMVCNDLPFYTEGIAEYQMYDAGKYWLGLAKQ